ncbi:dihydrofolate reductase [Mesoplasma syrphidae]|uniref:dihydrofolate reductase n=1 Tax=Mesoplasma syrphidae TaxID=225999 RepID=A0A2K9C8Y5_9MOLU|nr:dihydrofolate reductase [Mesoplasma syrphidae]AUF83485.1 dihydrofolate reductase [Mesoplasma syrphidae]
MIKLIWAQTCDGVIGKENKLPWSIKSEMDYFRKTTLNQAVLMGSATFVGMGSKALKNRLNYVLTREPSRFEKNANENLVFIKDPQILIDKYLHNPDQDLYVIGGAQVFQIFFDNCDELLRSIIKKPYLGDVYMPQFNYNKFSKVRQNDYEEFTVEIYKRVQNGKTSY